MKVSEIMTKNSITVQPSATAKDAAQVVQDGRLMGIVSTADIAEHARTCNVCIDNILNEVAKAER